MYKILIDKVLPEKNINSLLITVLSKKSNVLIFDEVTAFMDRDKRIAFYESIKEIKDEKIIIVITHNKEELKNCDEVFMLKNNKFELNKD